VIITDTSPAHWLNPAVSAKRLLRCLDASACALRLTAATDEKLTTPLFTLRIDGSCVPGVASREVKGAFEAVFMYSRRNLRAESPAGVELFKAQGCALDAEVEKHIGPNCCCFLPSMPASGMEYELLSMQGERLWLVDRSGDLAKQRPRALSTLPVVRR
jgi:hypothetical protein